jgi:hypothetical protein
MALAPYHDCHAESNIWLSLPVLAFELGKLFMMGAAPSKLQRG